MATNVNTGDSPGGVSPARAPGLPLAAIVGCEFMLQLDGTIVTVALPDPQNDLGLPAAALGGSLVPAVPLTAFAGGGQDVAAGVSRAFTASAFTASAVIAGPAIAVGIAAWFLPSRREATH